ncbi:hypothetical protein VTJ83DRAFT_5995 [Remersonia thermophila]|uniref:Co-chaperone HscB C-terminal oligomerisation domain-containing protein n=1 Tax=Remersonia thermophila TaxID=72144 RepID=A0ABR4D8G7_9PEZI
MRRSLVSSSGRTAAGLCAACRNGLFRDRRWRVLMPAPAAATATATAAAAAAVPARRGFRSLAQQQQQQKPRGLAPSARLGAPYPPRARFSSTDASSAPSASSPSSDIPTYYALFPETLPDGPPPRGKFHIDVRALRREFLRLQAASHPDFHHHAADASAAVADASSSSAAAEQNDPSSSQSRKSAARLRAEEHSALINAAYKTLSSPLLRAQYLLRELYGIDVESEGRDGDGDGDGSQLHPLGGGGGGVGETGGVGKDMDPAEAQELLFTVLEAREAIEEAKTEEELREVRELNEARIRESEAKVGEALESGDVKEAVGEVVRLRYWWNIREGIDHWEEGRGVVLHH